MISIPVSYTHLDVYKRQRNRAFKTLKQAQFALKIVEKAEELGYRG